MTEQNTLYKEVYRLACETDSLYRDTRPCRDDLLDFMDANEWFGQTVHGTGDSIWIPEMDKIRDALCVWLSAYRRSVPEKTDILIRSQRNRFPVTCSFLEGYLRERSHWGTESGLRMMDYLLSSLEKELPDYLENEIHPILEAAREYLGVANTQLLFDFITSMRRKGLSVKHDYKAVSTRMKPVNTEAYSLQEYAKMAYWIFNEDSWAEHHLLEKAAAYPALADLWLYLSTYFICAWRIPDLERLPAPQLPYDGETIRNMILERSFPRSEARRLAQEWMTMTGYISGTPSKTSAYRGVPDLKFFIPETLMEPVGIILAMALSHHDADTPCITAKAEKRELEKFFGKEFGDVAGKRRFMSRRANKAFLQGIEATADQVPGKALGYMLAALARSHKGGIGTIAKTTEIYLRDENFTGYTPEFILREMFERGIFGFIPVLLLEKYAGKEFHRLEVHEQTEAILELDLTPKEIEDISALLAASYNRAASALHEILSGADDVRKEVARTLHVVAAGMAPAKQDSLFCVRIALGYECDKNDRSCCIGCGYEIYTKTALQLLMDAYLDLDMHRESAEGWEKERFRGMILQGILPAISQIISSIRTLSPDTDEDQIALIMERGNCNAERA